MAQIFFRSWRNSIDPYPSLASLPEDEANENFCSGVSTTHCDTDVEIVPDTFDEGDVPHKKRHCLGTIETDRGGSVEPLLNLDACIVSEISDKRVSRCSGSDCLLSFHGECLYAAESGSSSEHLANPYCPYCRLKILSMKSKTLREKTVSAEKAAFKYLDKEMKSRDEDTTLSVDKNGNQEHSVDGTNIVSDQEVQGKKDDCSSKEEHVQVDDASHPSFLFSLAEKFGYSEWIQFDASVVRGLAYYTGIVFEGFDRKGKLRAICGGGRYDRLLSTYGGDDIPACGFGFGDAVIVELLKEKELFPELGQEVENIVCALDKDLQGAAATVATTLRDKGQTVNLVLESKPLKWVLAARVNARRLVLVGKTEWEDGSVSVKVLSSGEQFQVKLNDLE